MKLSTAETTFSWLLFLLKINILGGELYLRFILMTYSITPIGPPTVVLGLCNKLQILDCMKIKLKHGTRNQCLGIVSRFSNIDHISSTIWSTVPKQTTEFQMEYHIELSVSTNSSIH